MTKKEVTLAIDFGTSKTLAAADVNTGRPYFFRLGRYDAPIPSTAFLCEDGQLVFGEDADEMGLENPASYCRAFKSHLGSNKCLLGQYKACDLLREFLKKILARVKEDENQEAVEITGAVLTCPARFQAAQKEELSAAALSAGFPRVMIVPEVEAAGAAYCCYSGAKAFNTSALVVNWGGGTPEIAHVVRSSEEGYLTRSVHLGNAAGGEAIDEKLASYVGELIKAQGAGGVLSPATAVLAGVREMKRRLSAAEACVFRVVKNGVLTAADINRADFEKLLTRDVERIASAIQDVDKQADAKEKPEMVLLIGSSPVLTYISSQLAGGIGLKTRTWASFPEAAAEGALMLVPYRKWQSSLAEVSKDDEVSDIASTILSTLFVGEELPPVNSAVNSVEATPAALFDAVERKDAQSVEAILRGGVSPDCTDDNGRPPIFLALEVNDAACLKALIDAGADVHKLDSSGRSPLQSALRETMVPCLKLLIAAGADVNKPNDNGWPPLWYAAYKGYAGCVKELLAAPTIQPDKPNGYGSTPIRVAERYRHTECAELIRAKLEGRG